MFAVKHKDDLSHAPRVFGGYAGMVWSGKQGEEPNAKASSDHSLIRGLATALPWFVAGLARSTRGHRSWMTYP